MDILTRKYSLIEYLIDLKDESVLQRIETAISKVKNDGKNIEMKPFTENQLLERAKKSNNDFASGKYLTQEQLEKESENW